MCDRQTDTDKPQHVWQRDRQTQTSHDMCDRQIDTQRTALHHTHEIQTDVNHWNCAANSTTHTIRTWMSDSAVDTYRQKTSLDNKPTVHQMCRKNNSDVGQRNKLKHTSKRQTQMLSKCNKLQYSHTCMHTWKIHFYTHAHACTWKINFYMYPHTCMHTPER